MINIDEIRTALRAADARLSDLQTARGKVDEAHAHAEEALAKAMRLSMALVRSASSAGAETAAEHGPIPRPHVASLFRNAAGPYPTGVFAGDAATR